MKPGCNGEIAWELLFFSEAYLPKPMVAVTIHGWPHTSDQRSTTKSSRYGVCTRSRKDQCNLQVTRSTLKKHRKLHSSSGCTISAHRNDLRFGPSLMMFDGFLCGHRGALTLPSPGRTAALPMEPAFADASKVRHLRWYMTILQP